MAKIVEGSYNSDSFYTYVADKVVHIVVFVSQNVIADPTIVKAYLCRHAMSCDKMKTQS
ncbi:hypothetical protein PAXRUDRAFT_21102 [Paxillus rubicundulus Ve08.2h10]|uniref:Unplaced genomic scaffold scaffold_5164, whole genome shotgun sequence n=1 Tax=Paxillus rubicundulus Ve08.2h10 TaxID=930991 RepID=A0A0D0CCJ2_9AGAM|nr:hypothetical protein PAXRUDRAFT_21102 [Paxillus rubicundulus Ve08.2h10]